MLSKDGINKGLSKIKDIAAKAVGNKRGKPTMDGVAEHAYLLYMQGEAQKDIAMRLGVSEKTISAWKDKGNWAAKRAAKNISIDELVGKALIRINELLENKDFNADSFAKAVATLKTLKQRNTIDDEIKCFMDFQSFIIQRRSELEVQPEFIKHLTKLQDSYIQWRLGAWFD